ncbi:MAG: hypothetical protein ACLP4V_25460 [Methylocella sp.]
MDQELVLRRLSHVFKPYFEQDILRVPYPEPMPQGDFLAIEFTAEDPEGFRIAGLEPPEPDEMDDDHLAYVEKLRTYVRKLFKVAGLNLKSMVEIDA